MSKPSISPLSLTLVAALAAPVAWAAVVFNTSTAPSGAHLSNGSPQPSCTVDTLTVSCNSYNIGGVGNTDAELVLSAQYSATVTCTNNGGKLVNVKTQTTTTNSGNDFTDLRNGTLYVSAISVSAPTATAFLAAATCPNGNWTKNLADGSPALTSYSYTLTFQGYPAPAVSLP